MRTGCTGCDTQIPHHHSRKGPPRTDPVGRMMKRVEITDTCWLWPGATNGIGYGRIGVGRGAVYTHRLAYETAVGPVPDGMVLDHLCFIRNCVNPDHLEPVTQRENIVRGQIAQGRARHLQPHGTTKRYASGCRCDQCRAANAADHLAWYYRTKAAR